MPPKDEWVCEHGVPLEEYCEACEDPEELPELFDADELGLDPEDDDRRHYRGGERA